MTSVTKGILTVLVISLFIFLYLSYCALGSAFVGVITRSDTYVLAIGKGCSMYPTIKDGDYIIIDVTPGKIGIGDIIVYVHGNELICHRVIAITKEGYILKGDNNKIPDPWIVKDNQIIGKVVWIIDNDLYKEIADIWFNRKVVTTGDKDLREQLC